MVRVDSPVKAHGGYKEDYEMMDEDIGDFEMIDYPVEEIPDEDLL
jgi:hypothetical protein